jgi:C4-dicarboxylate-specific signal transduction histidine kinase
MTRVEIHTTIRHVQSTFEPFILDRDVDASLDLDPGNPYLRASEAAVESILINLVTNALNAFVAAPPGARKLALRTRVSDNQVTLTVSDNGPGIEGISVSDIWLPGQTTSPTGTGLGLTIVRDSVKDLGGSVDAIPHGELGGAQFTIQLPILGA